MTKVKAKSSNEQKLARVKARILGQDFPKEPHREFRPERECHTQRWNVVCFKCRTSSRVPGGRHDCPQCGEGMVNIGTHLRVPKRRDKKAWRQLEKKATKGW